MILATEGLGHPHSPGLVERKVGRLAYYVVPNSGTAPMCCMWASEVREMVRFDRGTSVHYAEYAFTNVSVASRVRKR